MEEEAKQKSHRKRQAGPKAEKKKSKKHAVEKNPKAFTYKSAVRAARSVRRNLDLQSKREHLPSVDRTPQEPPPLCVAVVGPPKVGKSTLIQGLVRNFARQSLSDIQGPVTVVSGECKGIALKCKPVTAVILSCRQEAQADHN